MSSKTKTTSNTNQTQTSAPPTWTLPGITTAANDVTAAIGQIPTSHYTGDQVAFMSPAQLQAIQSAYGSTSQLAGQYTDWMQQQLPSLSHQWDWQSQLPDTAYNVGSQYDVTPAINAALAPVYDQLTQQILPGIKSSALDSGAYTGDRAMIVAPQAAISDYTRHAADTAATIGYQNYNDFENRRLAAYGAEQQAAINAYQAETQRGLGQEGANASLMSSIGDYVNNILHTSASVGDLLKMSADLGVSNQQAQYDNALAKDKYASYSPFMGLDEASQLLATLSGGWGTQTLNGTTTQTTKQSPGALDFLKAGIGAAGLVAGIPFGGAASSGMAGGGQFVLSPTAGQQASNAFASSVYG